jgi:TolA-binding protein
MADRDYVPLGMNSAGSMVAAAQTVHQLSSAHQASTAPDYSLETPSNAVERHKSRRRLKRNVTLAVVGVALASVVTALLAMTWHLSTVCYVAFCIPLAVAPYTIVQRVWLNKMPTFRQVINQCREACNRLYYQNGRLHEEISRLQLEVAKLEGLEEELQQTAQQNGLNVEEFRCLVKENGEVQREMKVGWMVGGSCSVQELAFVLYSTQSFF